MFKNKRIKFYFSIIFVVLVPILLALSSSLTVFLEPFDYNNTLLTNIYNSVGTNHRFVLTFDDNKKTSLKEFENMSKVMRLDFEKTIELFRTSNETINISTKYDVSENVILSDIDINYFKTSNRVVDVEKYAENIEGNPIFISDVLATKLDVWLDHPLNFECEGKNYEFTVAGIYRAKDSDNIYLNNSFLKFDKPVCFVPTDPFNAVANNNYSSYLSIYCSDTSIKAGYNELAPFLKKNHSLLTISPDFTLNNFKIGNEDARSFQVNLLKSYQSQSKVLLYIYYAVLVALFIVSARYLLVGINELILNNSFIYKHRVLFCFTYVLYILGITLLSAKFVSLGSHHKIVDGAVICKSISSSLLIISLIMPLIAIVAICGVIYNAKIAKQKYLMNRKDEIDNLSSKNDKVIFVTGSLCRAGAEKVIAELANYYASMGRKVDIVLLLKYAVEWDLNKNINIIDFTGNTESRLKRISYWIRNLKEYFKNNIGSTIVSFLVRVNILVLLSAKKENHQLIISERNDPRHDGRGIIVSFFVNMLYPKADKIVFQTEECKELFNNEIQEKGIVIPNPIRINEFASIDNYKKNYFISAGRLAEQKNQITIIESMSIVIKTNKDVIVEIYGDGKLLNKFEKLIDKKKLQNNVFIFPNTKELNSKILSSTAYICSSVYEGMSNSLMEASYSGVPCITTRCLGTNFIKDDENGYFIDFASPKDLARKILKMVNNDENYVELRNKSIQIAKKCEHEDVYLLWEKCIDNE